jgi:8-oxo-dGTP pyrophosphatase MutT (NUDIX family)
MSPYFRELRTKVGTDLLLVPSVAAVIHDGGGRLLLQQKASGEWSLPAGAIEPGESPEQAVRREVREETGLAVEPREILGVFGGRSFRYVYSSGDIVEYTVVVYRCEQRGPATTVFDPETKALEYFERAAMPALALPYPMAVLFPGEP